MNRQQILVLAKSSTVSRQLVNFVVAISSPLLKKSQYLGGSINGCISLFLLGIILSITLSACSGTVGANQGDVKLNLVSFSVTEAV